MEEAKYTNRQWITLFVPTDSVHQFDVIKYKIEVELLPASPDNKIKGHTTIQAKSLVNGFNLLALDFIGMVVDSCKVNTQSALYTRSSNLLNINLGGNYNTGTYFTAEVFYHGLPQAGFYFDQNSYGTPVYYSFTQPYDSRYWFPCYDYPEDKAHCEVICTVPDNNFAVSNGQLYRVTNNQSGSKTYHWIEYYNIATYLISITVSNFVQIDTSLQFEEYELPVQYWVYPQDASKAAIDFKNTPAMIQFFSGLWGDYPFLADKYSMVQAELSGAMEHQTCTSWGIPITGDTRYEHVVAHELAHHWWGNWVTCHDYANIWLNEGFASYAEALWKEEKYGLSAFKNHMIAFEGNVFASRKGSVKYPIYNPPETYLFGTAVYKKGAWVLHMLRHILGDSIFQQGLAYYGLSHSYRTSTTEQFQAALEEFSGQDLDWFFDEWIYSPNYPIYKWSWVYTSFAGYYYLDINLGQKQDDPLVFRMPIEFKLSTAAKDTFFTVFDSLREQRFSMVLSSPPTGLIWDPNYKLLSADTLTTYPYLAGDVDGNRLVMLGDAIYLVNMLFYGFPLPTPPAAADVSGDCKISLADIIYLVNYVFGRGSPPRIGCP
jgi:aminopeptidase N